MTEECYHSLKFQMPVTIHDDSDDILIKLKYRHYRRNRHRKTSYTQLPEDRNAPRSVSGG